VSQNLKSECEEYLSHLSITPILFNGGRPMVQIKAAFYQQAQFFTSAAQYKQLPSDEGREVAFVGRSNSGKSSALNALTQQKKLAQISKTPGRTQLINVFTLSEENRLIDLPGYGYAEVAREKKATWNKMITDYLEKRGCLKGIVVLMDIRHPLKPLDWQLLDFIQNLAIPIHILLNKSDKFSLSKAKTVLFSVENALKKEHLNSSVQLFSATTKKGLEDLWERLDMWFERG